MSRAMHPQIQYTMPAEWAPQESIWMAWPSHEDLWQENLKPTQKEFTDLCKMIGAAGTTIELACLNEERMLEAQTALSGLEVNFHLLPYGEIWFRDTLPVFKTSSNGGLQKSRFHFNGWGEKYMLPGDERIGDLVSDLSPGDTKVYDWVLEGGSVEVDGNGLLLTSRQCLLNPNRNPTLNETQIEARLRSDIGAEKILWLNDGLINDHTDGHIDTMARFVAPGEVALMSPLGKSDPNYEILTQMHQDLSAMTDLQNRPLKIHTVPSVGELLDEEGELMPASYMNFLISNGKVIVPIYGNAQDQEAVQALKTIFPRHQVHGLMAKSILTGGGAFHCITQQIPKRVNV